EQTSILQKTITLVGFSILALFTFGTARCADLWTRKVFVMQIGPEIFNWTTEGTKFGYWFRASLANSPDLPNWMNYLSSKNLPIGYLYGVPPAHTEDVKLELVGLRKDNYETRRKIININIRENSDPAKFFVVLKIDNLNLEDLFDKDRLNDLLKIFTDELWTESKSDLQMTLIASALEMGGRLPLHPNDGEGVVVHLGSTSKYSQVLLDLQDEVKPLYKFTSCPRDFKRSTVDRRFRPKNFLIDWCFFRLYILQEKSDDSFTDNAQYHEPERVSDNVSWNLVRRESLPRRHFAREMLTVLVIPFLSLFLFIVLLSFVLCFHYDKVTDDKSDDFFESVFSICENYWSDKQSVEDDVTLMQYEAVQRATTSLRSSGFKSEDSPRQRIDKKDNCRPSPPPYNSAIKRINYRES
ncbi:epsilon-sarcoglycan, partial [Cimex lectularius]|uniref:Epsilon-sarcoglycan n=1 Tax=Cimex lectularius TaxID=79782 RepID=A0A8I6SU77_CIMLE